MTERAFALRVSRWPVAAPALFDRLALGAPILLALAVGFGDIAQVSPLDSIVVNGVHSLLPLSIVLVMITALRHHRLPALPRGLAAPTAAWLCVLFVSATFANSHRTDAFAALERPITGVFLAWTVFDLCRERTHWQLLLRALSLGGLLVAAIALAEASGAPSIVNWLTSLQEGAIPIGDVPRVAAALSHPNEAAMLLELALPLLLAWAWTAAPRWRVPLIAATTATLLAIVLTFSRTGIVAALLALAIPGMLSLARHEPRRLVPL